MLQCKYAFNVPFFQEFQYSNISILSTFQQKTSEKQDSFKKANLIWKLFALFVSQNLLTLAASSNF